VARSGAGGALNLVAETWRGSGGDVGAWIAQGAAQQFGPMQAKVSGLNLVLSSSCGSQGTRAEEQWLS